MQPISLYSVADTCKSTATCSSDLQEETWSHSSRLHLQGLGWAAVALSSGPPQPPARRVPPAALTHISGPTKKLGRPAEPNTATPVGMDAPSSPSDEPKISKAQRKNLKRAEKKAAERRAENWWGPASLTTTILMIMVVEIHCTVVALKAVRFSEVWRIVDRADLVPTKAHAAGLWQAVSMSASRIQQLMRRRICHLHLWTFRP